MMVDTGCNCLVIPKRNTQARQCHGQQEHRVLVPQDLGSHPGFATNSCMSSNKSLHLPEPWCPPPQNVDKAIGLTALKRFNR